MDVAVSRWTAEHAHTSLFATPSGFTAVFQLWMASWEIALSAVETASRSGAFSPDDAAAHRTVIAAERELVTTQLTLLARQSSYPSRTRDRRLVRARTQLSDDVLSSSRP
jgi:hypothetical protein